MPKNTDVIGCKVKPQTVAICPIGSSQLNIVTSPATPSAKTVVNSATIMPIKAPNSPSPTPNAGGAKKTIPTTISATSQGYVADLDGTLFGYP